MRCCPLEPSPKNNLNLLAYHPEATTERTTSTASTQHLKTLELNTNRKIAHDFRSSDLLQAINEQSAKNGDCL